MDGNRVAIWYYAGLILIQGGIYFQYFKNNRVGIKSNRKSSFSCSQGHRNGCIAGIGPDINDQITFPDVSAVKIKGRLIDINLADQGGLPVCKLNVSFIFKLIGINGGRIFPEKPPCPFPAKRFLKISYHKI